MKKLILLILIIGGMYYGYNNWLPQINSQTEIKTEDMQIQAVNPNEWLTHSNTSYANYFIQYPGDWKVSYTDDSTTFMSADNIDSVVISLQNNNSSISGIQTIKEIAGQQVLIVEGEDPDDGSPAKYILFNLNNNEKLQVRGFGTIFDKMIDTLVINTNQPQVEDSNTTETIDDEQATEENTEDQTINETESDNISGIVEAETPAEETTSEEEFIIKIFYQKDVTDDCSQVIGIIKDIDTRYNTDEVNALVTLTQGLSPEEINQGYTTSLASGTRLRNLEIKNGIATADFNSFLNEGGGSCNMVARRAQITETLMQFPDIEQVIISMDGSIEEALQP